MLLSILLRVNTCLLYTSTDRTDLDDQLSKQFVGSKKYIGDETVVSIESREKLREELQGRELSLIHISTLVGTDMKFRQQATQIMVGY